VIFDSSVFQQKQNNIVFSLKKNKQSVGAPLSPNKMESVKGSGTEHQRERRK